MVWTSADQTQWMYWTQDDGDEEEGGRLQSRSMNEVKDVSEEAADAGKQMLP